jgi:glycosyltransferase involved in cell wall biosynthesis
MKSIVQIAPEIAAGSGVGGVAWQLERSWQSCGVTTERFTLAEAAGNWLPQPGPGLQGKLALALRVFWFSTVGTVLARRFLARRPDAVSVCHNDVLAGDVYVNHGILRAAMRARGHGTLRMLRNPLHVFTSARDRLRYRLGVHRAVVSLTSAELQLLEGTYPRLRPRPVVIGNGVDVERFRPPTPAERSAARRQFHRSAQFPRDATMALFVGHEFHRKGLPLLLEAMAGVPASVHLLVIGGTADMVAAAAVRASQHGLSDRVHLFGRMADPLPAFQAADLFVLPSAYEANALVVLEALACGLPVVTTPVGYAPDVIDNGVNGVLVERSVDSIRRGLMEVLGQDLSRLSQAARASALPHAWTTIAERYLSLVDDLSLGRHKW